MSEILMSNTFYPASHKRNLHSSPGFSRHSNKAIKRNVSQEHPTSQLKPIPPARKISTESNHSNTSTSPRKSPTLKVFKLSCKILSVSFEVLNVLLLCCIVPVPVRVNHTSVDNLSSFSRHLYNSYWLSPRSLQKF